METVSDYDKKIDNLRKRIEFLFESKKYELAIKECEILLEEKINDYFALYHMVLSYMAIGDNNTANEVVLNLVENYPENSYAHKLCGSVYFNMDSLKFAINCCSKAIELDPNNSDAYYIKAFSLKKLGGYENSSHAVTLIQKALSLAPQIDEYHTLASGLYTHVGQYYRAKKEGERALELDPESSNAYLNYGCSLIYLGELDESIKSFYECLKLDPNNKIARKNIDIVRAYMERPRGYYNYLKIKFFDEDLRRDINSEAFVILANIFLKQGKYTEALDVFYNFLAINKKAVKRHIKYAEMLYNEGAMAEALVYLKKLKESNPESTEIDCYIEKIYKKSREVSISIASIGVLKVKTCMYLNKKRKSSDYSNNPSSNKSSLLMKVIMVILILRVLGIILSLH